MAKNNAKLIDIQSIIAAGIDPKTGLPRKLVEAADYKGYVKNLLILNDEQIAINRYSWFNLPKELNSILIERVLYYRGQGAFFYMKNLDKFFFLPYALDGEIDVYGRYRAITPLPFNGSTGSNEKEQKPWIKGLIKIPRYEVWVPDEDITLDQLQDSCVLLHDYSQQISQYIVPRQNLNQGIIDIESDCIPFLHTALLKGTGINGMRVNSQDEQSNVEAANQSLYHAALTGAINIPIVSLQEFQELTGGNVAVAEQYLLSMQSLDNFRLGSMGVQNGGLFQKQAHQLEREAVMNGGGGSVNIIAQDGLDQRQRFCDIVNTLWGLDIWCELSESANDIDLNGDGIMLDEPEISRDQTDDQGGEENDM